MEINQCISAGVLQLILTTCVVYGSNIDDSGIFLDVLQLLIFSFAEVTHHQHVTCCCTCSAYKILSKELMRS